jgi:prevent-host-death family protein
MSLIGVRELREQTSEVIRQVREEMAEYVITYQGRPVAIILPLDSQLAEKEMARAGRQAIVEDWERYHRLAEEIRKEWPEDVGSQEVLDAIRR